MGNAREVKETMNNFETEGPTLTDIAVVLAVIRAVAMLWYAAC